MMLDLMQEKTEFLQVIVFDSIVDGLPVPSGGQDVLCLHQAEMLRGVLQRRIDG